MFSTIRRGGLVLAAALTLMAPLAPHNNLALDARAPQSGGADPALLAQLDVPIERMQRAAATADRIAVSAADLDFHHAIYGMANSTVVRTLWEAIARHVTIVFAIETYRVLNLDLVVEQHRSLRRLLLDGDDAALDREVDDVLENLADGRLIFNLGHGILPQTPIAHVERMLKRVRR